jgi:hypothetical protein
MAEILGQTHPNLDADGNMFVDVTTRKGTGTSQGYDVILPNLCDQTTWYQQATKDTGTVCGNQLSNYKFEDSANPTHVWIDPSKIVASEDHILLRDGTRAAYIDYRPSFTTDTGGDNTPISWEDVAEIDYANRQVTFKTDRNGQNIKFTGYRVTTADHFEFLMQPGVGMTHTIEYAELQFSHDVDLDYLNKKQYLRMEVLIGAFTATSFESISFDTKYWETAAYDANGGAQGLADRKTYTHPYDFESLGNQGTGEIPDWGGKGHTSLVFPFNYVQGVPLAKSSKMGLRISIVDTTDMFGAGSAGPLTGTFATATLYGYTDVE